MNNPTPEEAAVLIAKLVDLEKAIAAAKQHFAAFAGFTPVGPPPPEQLYIPTLAPSPTQPTPLTPAEEARVEQLKLRERQALVMMHEAKDILNGRVGENWGARSAARHLLDRAKTNGPLPDGID